MSSSKVRRQKQRQEEQRLQREALARLKELDSIKRKKSEGDKKMADGPTAPVKTVADLGKVSATTIQKIISCWELCGKVVGNCDRVLLWGVSGTGKSWAARKFNLKSEIFSVSLTDDTPAAELRGHYGLVEGSYKWLDGPCTMAWRRGCRLALNELEKASGDAQTYLLGVLDDLEIAQQTLPTGETLCPQQGFHVVATMNGNPETDLLPALRDRFPVCIHIDQVSPEALAKLPDNLQKVAKNSGIVADVQRRISVRAWNEFAKLRNSLGDELASECIFGARSKDVLNALKLA
jgi:hypothetical protein